MENEGPAWGEGEGWRLGTAPRISIGVQNGPEEYQLFRVSSSLRLPDGGIAVGNSGSREVRFYNADGTHRLSVGREGEGPGEFRRVQPIAWFTPDSIGVWDSSLARATILGVDGGLGRTIRDFYGGDGFVQFLGFDGDGSFVATMGGFRPDTVDPGVVPIYVTFLRVSSRAQIDTIASLFSNESLVRTTPDGRPSMTIPHFPRNAVNAFAPGVLVHGGTFTGDLQVLQTDRTVARVIRASRPPTPVTVELVERSVAWATDRIEDPVARSRRREDLESLPAPTSLPTYSDLILARDGHIWAADYRLPWEEQPVWTVFSPEGVELGRVETPIGFTVHEIGADCVLGLERDELGVERIILYDLVKPK